MPRRHFRIIALLAVASTQASAATQIAGPNQLRICASDLTNFDDLPTIAIPAGLVFAAWGRAPGDLRSLRLDPNYPPARETGQSAIVVTAAVTLTADRPCALAPAQALVSSRRAWRSAAISPSDGNVYQAVDTLGPDGVRSLGHEERSLSQLLSMNILTASPAGPIGNPRMLP